MMPILHAFQDAPSMEMFEAAMQAQMVAFPCWDASREIGPALVACGVVLDSLAYLNASPYRAGAGGAKDVFPSLPRKRLAANAWVRPMLQALRPGVVVAHGVVASEVLTLASPAIEPVVFYRDRVKAHRDSKNEGFVNRLAAALANS